MRSLVFDPAAFEDLAWWVREHRPTALRIMRLIEDVQRDPFKGLGNPEPLRHELSGCWSRRIDREHRLVYQVLDEIKTRHAPLYRVLIHNDPITSMDFVCGVLKFVFNKSFRESVQIMLEAHNRDVALVAMETREQAEFHVERAHSLRIASRHRRIQRD